MKYAGLTRKIIGCCMKVHSTLGSGFQPGRRAEVIYQRALVIEFEKQGLGFAREMEEKVVDHWLIEGVRFAQEGYGPINCLVWHSSKHVYLQLQLNCYKKICSFYRFLAIVLTFFENRI